MFVLDTCLEMLVPGPMKDLDAFRLLKRIISQQKTTVEIDAHFTADTKQRRMKEEGLEVSFRGAKDTFRTLISEKLQPEDQVSKT